MAQLLMCLPYEHKDLSSDPYNHVGSCGDDAYLKYRKWEGGARRTLGLCALAV